MHAVNHVEYTDHKLVTATTRTAVPGSGKIAITGYGGRIPTRYKVRYGAQNRWYRVYMMQYGNAGTAYITVAGKDLVLDTDTEHELQNG